MNRLDRDQAHTDRSPYEPPRPERVQPRRLDDAVKPATPEVFPVRTPREPQRSPERMAPEPFETERRPQRVAEEPRSRSARERAKEQQAILEALKKDRRQRLQSEGNPYETQRVRLGDVSSPPPPSAPYVHPDDDEDDQAFPSRTIEPIPRSGFGCLRLLLLFLVFVALGYGILWLLVNVFSRFF